MAKYGGASAFLLVGGKDISADTFQLDETVEEILAQSDGFKVSWQEFLGTGKAKTTLAAGGGFYDDATLRIVDALQAKSAAAQVVGYGMAGSAIGADVVMLDGGIIAHFKRIFSEQGLTQANGEYVISGRNYRGQILHGLTAEAAATGNTQSTPVDQSTAPRLPSVAITSSSVANPTNILAPLHGLITGDVIIISGHSGSTPSINAQNTVTVVDVNNFTIPVNVTVGGTGGTFVKVTSTNCIIDVHAPALTLGGYTNVAIQPIHSVDASTWVDMGSAATLTAAGTAQRLTFSGQVRRYTGIRWSYGGAGAAQSVMPYAAISR